MFNINTLIENTREIEEGSHYRSLLGQRPSGSRWTTPVWEADLVNLIEESTPEDTVISDGYVYLHGFKRGVGALGFCKVSELEEDDVVTIVDGAHGFELSIPHREMTEVDNYTVILGMDGMDVVIFTAHPGDPSDRIPKSFWEGKVAGQIIPHSDIVDGWAIKFKGEK